MLVLWWGASLQGAPPAPALRDLALLEDPRGTETVADVASAEPGRWMSVHGGFAAGYTRSAHWLRFMVDSPAGESWMDVLPFAAREVPYRGFVFRLRETDSGPRTCYLRLWTTSSSMLGLRLRTPGRFLSEMGAEYGVLLGNIGILLVVALLNLVSWSWLRERIHLLFIAYLLGLAAALAGNGGFVAQYLFPSSPLVVDAWVGVAHLVNFSIGAALYRRLLLVERRQHLSFADSLVDRRERGPVVVRR